ncbi:MAG: zinc-binding dehydrogenase [Candidatus Firestonebacteria bacterium]
MKIKKIAATAKDKVELIEAELPDVGTGASYIEGPAVSSVMSPGTELSGVQGLYGNGYPMNLGYATVFKVEKCGGEVKNFKPGDFAFYLGNHASYHRAEAQGCVKVPEGLDPAAAPFARLIGISMSTLNTTSARPPSKVLITGLGIVGNLAAQLFQHCGYEVYAVEPNEIRRKFAENCGLKKLFPAIPAEDPELKDKIQLALDCSGHEKAVIDALKIVARKGEVVLLGVPWKRNTDIFAHEAFHAVFHKYAVLRSGWEWEIPRFPETFKGNSMAENFTAALNWLKEENITVDGIYDVASPKEAGRVYESYLQGRAKYLTTVFNWKDE